jgi:hypothetical protein
MVKKKEIDDLVEKHFCFANPVEDGHLSTRKMVSIFLLDTILCSFLLCYDIIVFIIMCAMNHSIIFLIISFDKLTNFFESRKKYTYIFDACTCLKTRSIDEDVFERFWTCPVCAGEIKIMFTSKSKDTRIRKHVSMVDEHLKGHHAAGDFPFYSLQVPSERTGSNL